MCIEPWIYKDFYKNFRTWNDRERNIRLMCPDPNLVIIKEIFTGSTQDRPSGGEYYPRFMPGDNIYFDSVSRMARDEDDGVKEYLDLYKRKVNLFFFVEPGINTDVYRESLSDANSTDWHGG